MSLKHVLFQSPWIPYNDKFLQSRITLTYPENVIFTAQFLKHVMDSDIYTNYPQAEKMDFSVFQQIDWKNALIVFDDELHLILAPDPVHQLVRLDRRLNYKQAVNDIFGSFRFLPFLESFRYTTVGIFIILLFYVFRWVYVLRYKIGSLTLTNTILTSSQVRRNQ